MEYYTFNCGCKVKILNPEIKKCDGLPSIELDYYNLPHCKDTWGLLHTGKTKGVFQVEKSLGKHWCKEIKPLNITDLSALIALIRPGCLEGLVDGKSLTQHYANSKNGKSEKLQIHPALDVILGQTQNILVFQEQAILIAQEIAGFNGSQADTLRRGIGHKDPAVLFGLEKEFIEGCLKTGKVSENDSRVIFDLIKKGCRYSFNASHAYAYAEIGYYTSYAKYHVPLHFFASYIAHAKDKQDQYKEIKELINDAKQSGIKIESPNLWYINNTGDLSIQDQKILYGLIDIKGIGRANVEKLYENVKKLEESLGNIKTWSWEDLLFNIDTTSTVMNNLILVGATNGSKPRKQKAYEFAIYNKLTTREKEWAKEHYKQFESLGELLKKYSEIERKSGGPSNEARRGLISDLAKNLISSPFNTKDHPEWIIANERELLGLPITYSSMEIKQIAFDTTCDSFLSGKKSKKFIILGEISEFNEYITKRGKSIGQPMGVFNITDETGTIKCLLFSNNYQDYRDLLFNDNIVVVYGTRGKEQDSLIIEKMEQA